MYCVTVERYHELYEKHIKKIHIKTVYCWLAEEKLEAKKDPGGRGWIIYITEKDPLFPFVVRNLVKTR